MEAVTKSITEVSEAIEDARREGNGKRVSDLTQKLTALIKECDRIYGRIAGGHKEV